MRGAAAIGIAVIFASVAARAEPVDWLVDEALSEIELVVPDQDVTIDTTTANVRFRNQSGGDAGPWSVGNVAALGGVIATDYVDGASIQFLAGQHDLFALVSGSYRPNPAVFDPQLANEENPDGQFADASPAPGAYGARVRAAVSFFLFDAAFVNFTEALYDLDSGVLPIASGSFSGDALDFGLGFASVAFDGLDTGFAGQPLPDAEAFPILAALGPNLSSNATVTAPLPAEPDLRMLTLPIDADIVVDVGGVELDATVLGAIVAFTTLPEPAVPAALAAGALLLAALARRRP